MRNLNKLAALLLCAVMVSLFLPGCKKELVVGTTKPDQTAKIGESNKLAQINKNVHYGREFAYLDSTVRDSEMVITSFGPRLKSDVHLIPEGHKLKYSGTHLQEVEIATGKLINDFGVQAPLKYLKANLQNNISGGKTNNKVISAAQVDPSWKTWAQTSTLKTGINGLGGSWMVPTLPTTKTDGQVIYVFIGLEDANGHSILQPLLQYGYNGMGGIATSWTMSNTFIACPGCTVYDAPWYMVTTGTYVQGQVQLSGTGLETVNSSISTSSQTSTLPTETAITPFTTAVATLESYYITGTNDYPTDNYVTITLPQTENLVPEVNSPSYGEHTVIVGSSIADLFFRTVPAPIISYTTPDAYNANSTITPLTPTNIGGAATSYSVSPTLPLGLTLNTTSGVISGTPVTGSAATNYTVTATNSSGTGQFIISISVNGPTINFDVSSSNTLTTYFYLIVNGANESGSRSVAAGYPIVVTGIGGSSTSTVVLQVSFGHMPTAATIYAPEPINGVISGNNITFTGANLSAAGTIYITIN